MGKESGVLSLTRLLFEILVLAVAFSPYAYIVWYCTGSLHIAIPATVGFALLTVGIGKSLKSYPPRIN